MHPTQYLCPVQRTICCNPVRTAVDVLIAPMVQALMAFPDVKTRYSCQGEPFPDLRAPIADDFEGWEFDEHSAWVTFTVGDGSGAAVGAFVDKLASALAGKPNTVHFVMHWFPGNKACQAEIRLEQSEISKVARILARVAADIKGVARC